MRLLHVQPVYSALLQLTEYGQKALPMQTRSVCQHRKPADCLRNPATARTIWACGQTHEVSGSSGSCQHRPQASQGDICIKGRRPKAQAGHVARMVPKRAHRPCSAVTRDMHTSSYAGAPQHVPQGAAGRPPVMLQRAFHTQQRTALRPTHATPAIATP